MKKVAEQLKDNFIPNSENDHKPYVLRRRTIAFVLMIVIIGECAFILGSTYFIPRSKLYGIVDANALVDETNAARSSNNLPALQVSSLLQAAAQEKANDMATKGYFAHTSPQGLTPWYWFENVGYDFDYAGENLAVNFSDSEDVTNAWMNSPEHRANILDTDYTQIGIATAQGIYNGQEATYVVEEFGTPAPVSAPVAFVNTADAASVPTTAPISPVATAPSPAVAAAQPTKAAVAKTATPAPVSTATAKPAALTPAPTPVAVVPTVVAMENTTGTNSAQTFVAVKAAQTTATAPTTITTTGTLAVPASAIGLNQPQQSNWIETILSDPKAIANDFYLLLIVLFGAAIILNVFIKIRIQYPKLIVSGLAVIVIAGLCIVLNQNIGLLHAAIL